MNWACAGIPSIAQNKHFTLMYIPPQFPHDEVSPRWIARGEHEREMARRRAAVSGNGADPSKLGNVAAQFRVSVETRKCIGARNLLLLHLQLMNCAQS